MQPLKPRELGIRLCRSCLALETSQFDFGSALVFTVSEWQRADLPVVMAVHGGALLRRVLLFSILIQCKAQRVWVLCARASCFSPPPSAAIICYRTGTLLWPLPGVVAAAGRMCAVFTAYRTCDGIFRCRVWARGAQLASRVVLFWCRNSDALHLSTSTPCLTQRWQPHAMWLK